MKQVADLYQDLVGRGAARSIHRFNLRKFTRSFGLPPCGVSFWEVEDLNWDYLYQLNGMLTKDKFYFSGGEYFPRIFFEHCEVGQDRRTEFLFLYQRRGQHMDYKGFFGHRFSDSLRTFGSSSFESGAFDALRSRFHSGLIQDMIHFAHAPQLLMSIAHMYFALFLLTFPGFYPDVTRDGIFNTAKTLHPTHRADIARIVTSQSLEDVLNDILYLFSKMG